MMAEEREQTNSFVLISGAGGSAWNWHLVVAELEARGHEAIAVDILQDDESLGLPEYADIVERAIGNRRSVVLVALSMGAFTAATVASRVPVRLIALVNAMVPLPGETPGQWWENTDQPGAMKVADEHAGRRDDFDQFTYFLHDVPEQVLAAAPPSAHRYPADTPFGQPCEFVGWEQTPVRSLIGSDDRLFPLAFQRRLTRERLGIEPDELPGGHLIPLSNPRGLAGWLIECVADLG